MDCVTFRKTLYFLHQENFIPQLNLKQEDYALSPAHDYLRKDHILTSIFQICTPSSTSVFSLRDEKIMFTER
jgi:hypothetical protein